MPLIEIPGPVAQRNQDEGRCQNWSDLRIPGELEGLDRGKVGADERLAADLFVPYCTPGFTIGPQESFFLMGACFSRDMEESLLARQRAVLSADMTPVQPFLDDRKGAFSRHGDRAQIPLFMNLNRYNVYTMRQQLAWAVSGPPSAPETYLEVKDGLYEDPQSGPFLLYADLDRVQRRRAAFHQVFSDWTRADVFILNLATSEAWFDHLTGLYLNHRPNRGALYREPDRFVYRVLTFEETMAALEDISTLLFSQGAPGLRALVTVEAVGEIATFQENADIVVANCRSKSLLRVAAQDWSTRQPRLDYFPGYEVILNSRRDVVLGSDRSHVTRAGAEHVVRLLEDNYFRA